MKKVIFVILACFFVISGCSSSKETVSSSKEKPAVEKKEDHKTAISSSPLIKGTNNTKKGLNVGTTQPAHMTQVFELDHLKLTLDKSWTINKGLDSASFQQNGNLIGGIDGLGYSDSIDSLLPNQSKVIEKKEMKRSGMKTYSVILQRDSTDGNRAKEIHILYLLPEIKVAYDLHFDLSFIDESNVIKIAETSMKK